MAALDDVIQLRYAATCSVCGTRLTPGSRACWDRATRTATCEACLTAAVGEIDRGRAGGSAAREWKRRHDKRDAMIRAQHKHLGGLILALSDDPQSTNAWATGAIGEQTIGESLERIRCAEIAVLHDRRIPGTRANIDHIVISAAGIFVIDTKHYHGRVELRDVGGWFSTDIRLFVGGRNRTKLVHGMTHQVEAVRHALAKDQDALIRPVLLFMGDDNWPLLATKPLRFGDVYILWGKKLGQLIRAPGGLGPDRIAELERTLADALPAA